MVQISQILGDVDWCLRNVWPPQTLKDLGKVAPLLEFRHPQAAIEAATQD